MVQKCIYSWEKYCQDYEIVEWNESKFDIDCNAYVKEAYEAKKGSFVTDYARLWIIYNYGGIYFDTDVEVIKNIDDTNEVKYIDGAVIFSKEYFCPLDYATKTMRKTKNTYTIHWFDASWKEESERILHEFYVIRDKWQKRVGNKLGSLIVRGIYLLIYPKKREVLKKL